MYARSRGDSASWALRQECGHGVAEGHLTERTKVQEKLVSPSSIGSTCSILF